MVVIMKLCIQQLMQSLNNALIGCLACEYCCVFIFHSISLMFCSFTTISSNEQQQHAYIHIANV
jgi:hypothetical protein